MRRTTAIAAIGLIVIAAFVLRAGVAELFVGLAAMPSASANPDQLDYEALAARLASGRGYTDEHGRATVSWPPGTSMTLAPIYALSGHSHTAGRLWFCLLSALTCAAAGWLAWQCAGRTAGVVAAAMLACDPGHFYHAMHFVSEGPALLWLTLGLAAGFHAVRHRSRPAAVAAGACWALAILTRPFTLLILPPAALVVLLARGQNRVILARSIACQLAVALLLVAPWSVRNQLSVGTPSLATIGGHTFWGAHNELILADPDKVGGWMPTGVLRQELHALPQGEAAMDAAAWRHGLHFLRDHPGQWSYLAMMKLWRLVSPGGDAINPVTRLAFAAAWLGLAPLMVWGLIDLWRRHRDAAVLLLLPLAATLATTLMFYGSTRFRQAVASVIVVAAAVPVAGMVDRLLARALPYRTTSRYEFGRPQPDVLKFPDLSDTRSKAA